MVKFRVGKKLPRRAGKSNFFHPDGVRQCHRKNKGAPLFPFPAIYAIVELIRVPYPKKGAGKIAAPARPGLPASRTQGGLPPGPAKILTNTTTTANPAGPGTWRHPVMKKTVLLILPLLLLLASPLAAQEIVAVADSDAPLYRQTIEAFRNACLYAPPLIGGVKTVTSLQVYEIAVNDMSVDLTAATIRARQPLLILAVGDRALQAAARVADVPIVYLLASRPAAALGGRDKATGVELQLPAALQLATIRRHLPGVIRLGVVYNPRHTGPLVAAAAKAAPALGMELITATIETDRKLPTALQTLRGRIDAYWIVPDPTTITPTTLTALAFFSMHNRVPLITFTDRFLAHGAALAITVDNVAMARQASHLARQILAGTPVAQLPPRPADLAAVHFNDTILRKLGGTVIRPALEKATP